MVKGSVVSVVVALVVSSFGAGCAVESEEADAPARGAQALTSHFEGVSVVGEEDASGVVRAEVKRDDGESILELRVEGERLVVEPRADRSIAPWSGAIPAEARAHNELSDWNYLAYAYAQHLAPPSAGAAGDVAPRMISAGTDGQMCIAAGGTWAECTYYLYCRSHWCPFW